MNIKHKNRESIELFLKAMYNFDELTVRSFIQNIFSQDVKIHMCHPFDDLLKNEFYDNCFAPLVDAIPDVERRDTIVVSGKTIEGKNWVGCCGSYIGTFVGPFLEIPPTGHLVHMRFHEFYCFEDDKIIEVQAIWDIPELMMQAGAWPMSPSLGREIFIPGPASQDGLTSANRKPSHGTESLNVVIEMLTNLSRHPSEGGPEIMKAEEYWHPCVNWYGPAGIGSMRGIDGFRNWHQIPFLKALPDRKGGTTGTLSCHFFGDGPYVIATGWPNMQMTVSGDGWLGIAPSGQEITMRSLDFWRVEDNLIRENWVLVDLLDVYSQLGVDVFARLREFNKARVQGKISYPIGGNK